MPRPLHDGSEDNPKSPSVLRQHLTWRLAPACSSTATQAPIGTPTGGLRTSGSRLSRAPYHGSLNYPPSASDWRTRPDRGGGANVDGHGIFGYIKNKVSVGRIPDGTSNTIMFAECAGGIFSGGAPFANNIWTEWSWGGGQWWAAYGICPNSSGVGINCQAGAGLGLSWVVAGSTHAGNVINMAFADGSVKGINPKGMDIFILSYLTGMQDGEVQGIDF